MILFSDFTKSGRQFGSNGFVFLKFNFFEPNEIGKIL